jgi:hypothetical protein
MAQQKKHDQDGSHVDACPRDLAVALFSAQVRANAEKKYRGTQWIDDRDKRYERDAHPGEEVNYALHGNPLLR